MKKTSTTLKQITLRLRSDEPEMEDIFFLKNVEFFSANQILIKALKIGSKLLAAQLRDGTFFDDTLMVSDFKNAKKAKSLDNKSKDIYTQKSESDSTAVKVKSGISSGQDKITLHLPEKLADQNKSTETENSSTIENYSDSEFSEIQSKSSVDNIETQLSDVSDLTSLPLSIYPEHSLSTDATNSNNTKLQPQTLSRSERFKLTPVKSGVNNNSIKISKRVPFSATTLAHLAQYDED